MYVYMYVCMYMYIYIYTYIYNAKRMYRELTYSLQRRTACPLGSVGCQEDLS